MMQTIIDQLDSELNLSPNPNLNYLREKVKELDQYATDQEDNARRVEELESELESVRDDFDDLEFKLDKLCDDIQRVINSDLSNEDKLTKIEDLIHSV